VIESIKRVWAIGAASASPFGLARRGRRPWNGKIFIKAHLLVLSFSFRLIKFFSVFYEAIRFLLASSRVSLVLCARFTRNTSLKFIAASSPFGSLFFLISTRLGVFVIFEKSSDF
jgi:hypothetical protein